MNLCEIAIWASLFLFGMGVLVGAEENLRPTDWADWMKYRDQVQHPAAAIKAGDLLRARRNIERYAWAKKYVAGLRKSADGIVAQVNPEYLAQMIERTTPGCVGPCPACRAKGLPWHPDGQWSWSADKPDQLTCAVCKTVFPTAEFPETIVLQSKWDPEQKFSFMGGETFKCHGYTRSRPSISGIIRARKVGYVTGQLYTLALAYALTEDPKYARAAKAIFLRLAEVLPKYLVRAGYGYGEYADCDPHVAAERISDLPQDELVYPPNIPDRKLYAGYWAASRIGSSGMDGGWICRVAQAYDLTCTAKENDVPVYSPEEQLRIEKDVLLESAYLAACDPAINNKSVGNRAGAAMVGMCVGHPGLVHFGLEGFQKTVDEWFLPDGGTSESPSYGMMTMGGIINFALMFRDYSDPPGYGKGDILLFRPEGRRAQGEARGAQGREGRKVECPLFLDHVDACRDTRYGDCWQDLLWTLQGDLRFPPSADAHRTNTIDASYAEILAVAYPSDEHVAYLKELAGKDLSGSSPERAIFYREPGFESREAPTFSLPDMVFPFLAQGYFRTGKTGRNSLVLLNASDWGGHHHLDSLNLYYWKDGRELLSDLGYLWDHPDSYQTRRTFAHNLVMVDSSDQKTQGRGGSFQLFAMFLPHRQAGQPAYEAKTPVTPSVKVMEASSRAYEKATIYRRTCIQLDHGGAGSYLVDIFRAEGGSKRAYVFHGPNNDYEVEGLTLEPAAMLEQPVRFAVSFQLPQVSEILVDDVEICEVLPGGKEGPNLATNPSASLNAEGTPPGWGYYSGDGKGEWGIASPGRTDERCVRVKALKPHANGVMNVALLVGESDGYKGPRALLARRGAAYKIRFWIKGNAPIVNVHAVTWPHDPNSSNDRSNVNAAQVSATGDWVRQEGTFTLPSGPMGLENLREAAGDAPWRITWRLDKDYRFAAFSPGGRGEKVVIGNGWGQRDYRNTDRGAVLPYILRCCEGKGLNQFVSVFVGEPKGRALIKGVRHIPLPEGAPPDAAAIEVQTAAGTDIVVSMLTPRPITLPTSLGEVTTDGRAALVSGDGKPAAAVLVGGTQLTCSGAELQCLRGAYGGKVLNIGGDRGESWFAVSGELPDTKEVVGGTLFIEDGPARRAYPIRKIATKDGQTLVYTKVDNVGFQARPGTSWEFIPTKIWTRPR